MNQGKMGKLFHYPNTFLLLLGYTKRHIFACHRSKPRELHKAVLKEKYLLSPILQLFVKKNKPVRYLYKRYHRYQGIQR
ncbi:MAG TPA: hypothetical protein VIY08_12605 [Candidatus Nitrosocosmicus sp.]